jgi:hypothetical protein
VNYVVGNDLDDVKNGKIGLSGYETSLDAYKINSCDEANKKLGVYTTNYAWIL